MEKAKHCGRAWKGSQFHLQNLVNDHQEYLSCLILSTSASLREFAAKHPQWVSPLKKDDYCEYQDEQFLKKVGSREHWGKLKDFWPSGGPVWDALATIEGKNGAKGVILLEAKSHEEELKGVGCKAKNDETAAKIEDTLDAVKQALGVKPDADWLGKYYQYANRIAHLYFLNIIAQVPTWLVFLYFVGDTQQEGPLTVAGWKTALGEAKRELALPEHHLLNDRITDVFAPITRKGVNYVQHLQSAQGKR